VVAVAAGRDAAHVDDGDARLGGLEADRRQLLGIFLEVRDVELVEPRVPIAWTLIGTFWRFSSRLVAVMMISVSSGTCRPAHLSARRRRGHVGRVGSGAGDWPVVCGAGLREGGSAKRGRSEKAERPAGARNVRSVIECPHSFNVTALRQSERAIVNGKSAKCVTIVS
jgi:hypothetical protein